ncbi:MAG TPA: hypothetical protein PLZ42_02310 [Methanothrix sp.]|nr:hypothetical protein [Methanothrix sp.]
MNLLFSILVACYRYRLKTFRFASGRKLASSLELFKFKHFYAVRALFVEGRVLVSMMEMGRPVSSISIIEVIAADSVSATASRLFFREELREELAGLVSLLARTYIASS